jgi:hypothetical protein
LTRLLPKQVEDCRRSLGDFERLGEFEPAPRLCPGDSGGLGRERRCGPRRPVLSWTLEAQSYSPTTAGLSFGLGGFPAAAWGLPADLVGAGGDGVDLCGQVGMVGEVLVGRGEEIGQGGRVSVTEGLV